MVMEGAPAVGVASSDTQPPPGGVFMKNGNHTLLYVINHTLPA